MPSLLIALTTITFAASSIRYGWCFCIHSKRVGGSPFCLSDSYDGSAKRFCRSMLLKASPISATPAGRRSRLAIMNRVKASRSVSVSALVSVHSSTRSDFAAGSSTFGPYSVFRSSASDRRAAPPSYKGTTYTRSPPEGRVWRSHPCTGVNMRSTGRWCCRTHRSSRRRAKSGALSVRSLQSALSRVLGSGHSAAVRERQRQPEWRSSLRGMQGRSAGAPHASRWRS